MHNRAENANSTGHSHLLPSSALPPHSQHSKQRSSADAPLARTFPFTAPFHVTSAFPIEEPNAGIFSVHNRRRGTLKFSNIVVTTFPPCRPALLVEGAIERPKVTRMRYPKCCARSLRRPPRTLSFSAMPLCRIETDACSQQGQLPNTE